MLTFEMLYAVLQGLPSSHLGHLDRVWISFCTQIMFALKEGLDPVSALRRAIQRAEYWQIFAMKQAFNEMRSVMDLSGLSYRQKEALLALRSAGVASLPQLSRVLMRDRSHTHKRLKSLIHRGLAVKFFRPDGIYYFAVPGPVLRSVKSAAHQMLSDLMQTLLDDTTDEIRSLSNFQEPSLPLPQPALDGSTNPPTPAISPNTNVEKRYSAQPK
jgi:DNA-binding MarR family transcriptional regulator